VPFAGQQTATTVSRAHQQIADALDAFEADVRPILSGEQAGTISPQGRAQMVSDAITAPSAAVDAAVAAAQARATEADRAYTAARQALTPSHSDVVAALRANAFWQRVCRELDSVKPEQLVARAQRLVADAKPYELAVLAEELPSFLRSKSVHASWMDQALEQVSLAMKTAATQRKRAAQAHAVVSSNARLARRAMQSAASGSYHRPRLVDALAYDLDAVRPESPGANRGPTTRGGGPASG
jgi:hypothetical protein